MSFTLLRISNSNDNRRNFPFVLAIIRRCLDKISNIRAVTESERFNEAEEITSCNMGAREQYSSISFHGGLTEGIFQIYIVNVRDFYTVVGGAVQYTTYCFSLDCWTPSKTSLKLTTMCESPSNGPRNYVDRVWEDRPGAVFCGTSPHFVRTGDIFSLVICIRGPRVCHVDSIRKRWDPGNENNAENTCLCVPSRVATIILTARLLSGRGGHGRADKDARARAVKSSNHRLKMTASLTFNYRIDFLQFSN